MKKHILFLFLAIASLCACEDDAKIPHITPVASGTFTDSRDGNEYGWIRIGDLEWMTENLRYGEPYYEKEYGGIFADLDGYAQPVVAVDRNFDFEADLQANGNFYTWEEACEYAPEGWRLATDDDWKNLEMALGLSASEADEEGWRGEYVGELLRQDSEGLGMRLPLSGWAWASEAYDDRLFVTNLQEFGYYWTATEKTDNGMELPSVYCRSIFASYNTVKRFDTTLDVLMRVRCVRDAQEQ